MSTPKYKIGDTIWDTAGWRPSDCRIVGIETSGLGMYYHFEGTNEHSEVQKFSRSCRNIDAIESVQLRKNPEEQTTMSKRHSTEVKRTIEHIYQVGDTIRVVRTRDQVEYTIEKIALQDDGMPMYVFRGHDNWEYVSNIDNPTARGSTQSVTVLSGPSYVEPISIVSVKAIDNIDLGVPYAKLRSAGTHWLYTLSNGVTAVSGHRFGMGLLIEDMR